MSFANPTSEQTAALEFLGEFYGEVIVAAPVFRHAIEAGHILLTARTAIGAERARWAVTEDGVATGHDPDDLVPVWHRRLQTLTIDPDTGLDADGYEPAPSCAGTGEVDLGAGGTEPCEGCEDCRMIRGYVVRANGDTGLDVPAGPDSIAERFGIGWGIYPPTIVGRALAEAAAAEWNREAEALTPGSIGTGPEQIPPAVVVPLLTERDEVDR